MRSLVILLIIIANSSFAQSPRKLSRHLIVADSSTLKGIDNVTISINQKRKVKTDGNGTVWIPTDFLNINDTLHFSCIGYNSKILFAKFNQKSVDTIWLTPSLTTLKEVRINSKTPEIVIGNITKKYNSHRIPNPDEIFAQYIPNLNQIKGTITSVEYVLNDELKGIDRPFKVGVYTKSSNSILPDSVLLKDSLIIYNKEKKKRLTVDISNYNIEIPLNGVIVTFETLSPDHYGTDSIWYDKKPFKEGWHLKMPGIDMNLVQKDSYPSDDEHDRKVDYSMVIGLNKGFDKELMKYYSYSFEEGNNLAITIKVLPE